LPHTAARLALPSVIGNRAMGRLLLRRPAGTDVITSVGTPGDYTRHRESSVKPLYADVATIAQASKLRDVSGTTENDINFIRSAKVGGKDPKPGLNFVASLSGQGETGFIDAAGVYTGPRMPVTLDGPLPRVAMMLGPAAFQHGKDGALGTLRHEMEHAGHMQMLIDWVERWRKSVKAKDAKATLADDAARRDFDAWLGKQTKGISKVDRQLIAGERDQSTVNTEVLAYTEGFVTAFHLGPQTPSLALAIDYPAAIESLWGLAKRFGSAHADIQAAAIERIRDYYDTVLDATRKQAYKDWLQFLIDHAQKTPSSLSGDELSGAKKIKSDFGSYVDFLKRVLARK
jgi:hypothetical protein